jgi:cbb3-type cytochrome oxidase subunit 3
MSFDAWVLALIALFFTGLALYALVKGKTQRENRRTDPAGYWLAVGFLVIVAALHLWMLARVLGGDESARRSAALILAPLCLYLVLKYLRAGEIVWGNNHFPRRGRAQAYWTILLLCLIGFAFFAGSFAYGELSGPL